MPGGDLQRSLLTASTDKEARATRLDRPWHVEHVVDPVVTPDEGGSVLGEHGSNDGQRLVETVHSLADWREVEAIADVLFVVPGGTDAQHGPAT